MDRQRGSAIFDILAVLLVLALLVFVGMRAFHAAANHKPTPAAANTHMPKTPRALKGVNLSPKSFSSADFSAFLMQAVKNGSVITWAGSWTELARPGSAPYTLAKLAGQYGYTVVPIAGPDRSGQQFTPSDEHAFVAAVADFAGAYKPAYMGLGNEVNRVSVQHPAEYAAFKRWFAEAAAAIKQKSPNTKVFTTFQYEQLNGLNGGLFGGRDDPAAAQWQLLDDFPAADLVVFTSYPYIVYTDQASIPQDYYSRAKGHTTKPIAFSEIGWPSGTEAAGHASTPAQQAAFVTHFASLTGSVAPAFVIWPFLYDQNLKAPFSTISLIDKNDTPKPALSAWQSYKP